MKRTSTLERRHFIWKAGAALSATVAAAASTAAVAAPLPDSKAELERLADQLGRLEDRNAIRKVQQAFTDAINQRRYEDIADLLVRDASPPDPAHVALQPGPQDVLELASDRKSATTRLQCRVQCEAVLDASCTLAEMARQQGQGVISRWEKGLYETSYVKVGAAWKILALRYRPD